MKNSENRKFEEGWREAFSEVEASPPDRVWTNIDLQLSRAESGDMKRRVVFYQRLAAASVFFAVALSGLGIWYSNKPERLAGYVQKEKMDEPAPRSGDSVKNNNTDALANTTKNSVTGYTPAAGGGATRNSRTLSNKKRNEGKTGASSIGYTVKDQGQSGTGAPKYDSVLTESFFTEKNIDNPAEKNNEISLNESASAESTIKNDPAPVQEIPVPLPLMEPAIAQTETKKKTNHDENWWASLGGAAGSYNSNATTPMYGASFGTSGAANSSSSAQTSRPGTGTSFSVGMNFGKKIAPRWMLMSGFNLLTQSSDYNSNVIRLSANNSAYAADYLSAASAAAPTTFTTPYTINSVNEFISIPFQAGYLFIDRKLGFQLNAGVATDFFVRNTLADQSGNLARYTQGAGDNSLYRAVNLTGLMGTELSYKVAQHYRVSVVPGLRYSFNSVLKPATQSTINPIVWDVGFRFRYMF